VPLYLPLSIAPMIDWSYSAFRIWMRLLAPKALVYTEMQTTGAVCHNPAKALNFHPIEHPIALQLGGACPKALREASLAAEEAGFDEINLNLGCPSDKVQAGRFGACLMREPAQVADCIAAMRQAVSLPISAKTRIGIDNEDSYAFFSAFVKELVDAGCQKLIVHARKAWLHGLNPKQNRTVPPLHYDYVYQIKQAYPQLPVHINGNVMQLEAITQHLQCLDGVMIGRLACDNPYGIALIHKALYPETPLLSRSALFLQYWPYVVESYQQGTSLSLLIRPLLNLAFGLSGARLWKKKLMALVQTGELSAKDDLAAHLYLIESQSVVLYA
jgi:tRNA-dihydrouridine synthase A